MAPNKDFEAQAQLQTLLDRLLGTTAFGSWVGGELVIGSGAEIELVNPATGQLLTTYADAGASVVTSAAQAAADAQKIWWSMSASARAQLMWKCSVQLRSVAGPLAELESLTAGKPIRDCRVEIAKVADMFEYYAGWCDKLTGQVIPVPTSHIGMPQCSPVVGKLLRQFVLEMRYC